MTLLDLLDGAPADAARCSARGCTERAVRAIHWRNPRIHDERRVKTWAACGAHADGLADWLRSRDFPVAVTEFGQTVASLAAAEAPGTPQTPRRSSASSQSPMLGARHSPAAAAADEAS